MRVNEIFYSLQGEGRFTGTPAVFLRLSGCNEKCPFCDTQHESYREMSEDDIVSAVSQHPSRHIVITGGEPTLQITPALTDKLHAAGFFIQIETNGSLPLPDGASIDWVTCSPKYRPVVIGQVDELKVLFMNQDLSQYDGIQAQEYRLQPLDSGDADTNNENLKQTIDYILRHPKWNLSLQTHKILKIQ